MTRALLVSAAALVTGFALAAALHGAPIVRDPEDLRAFYCAGQTLLAHHDPYLAEPLRSCEVRETLAAGLGPWKDLALPAPLPMYALVAFVPLSLLGFGTATTVFTVLLAFAIGATALLVARMEGFPLAATFLALALSEGIVAFLNGQIFPFALLALCLSAAAVRRDDDRSAGIFAALSALEPHVALPALLSLLYARPRSRVPIALSLAALAAVAIVVGGTQINLEYLLRVLPAHARSEATNSAQLSLTVLLTQGGLATGPALALGNLQYAVMCVLGVAVARRAARAGDANELLVLLPPAFAALGGPFIHLTQIAVAIPAAVALAMRFPRQRRLAGTALLLLAIPWQDVVENGTFAALVATACVSLFVAHALWSRNLVAVLLATGAMVALAGAESALRQADPPPHYDATAALAAVAQPDRLAEDSWQAFIVAKDPHQPLRTILARLPTWLALLMLVAAAALSARAPATGMREPSG